jgi:hypothetical protein
MLNLTIYENGLICLSCSMNISSSLITRGSLKKCLNIFRVPIFLYFHSDLKTRQKGNFQLLLIFRCVGVRPKLFLKLGDILAHIPVTHLTADPFKRGRLFVLRHCFFSLPTAHLCASFSCAQLYAAF